MRPVRHLRGAVVLVLVACQNGTEPAPAAPPTLSVWPGEQQLNVLLGTQLQLPVTLRSARGDTLALPSSFRLISRNPTIVSVESPTVIRARAMGQTWVVGSVMLNDEMVADSIQVTVGCTLELQVKFTPTAPIVLAVGASFTPTIELWTCSGQLQLSDTIRWAAGDSTVIRVDSLSGRTTGIRAGQTALLPHGVRYRSLPGIPVAVVSGTP
jgi:hypothetical protein